MGKHQDLRCENRNIQMKYTHIVFDVDGTILDTEEAVLKSLQRTLEEIGIKKEIHELTFCLGITGQAALEYLGVLHMEEVLNRWVIHLKECRDLIGVFDGMVPLLEKLKARGCTLGIVTSRLTKEYEADFDAFGLLGYFDTAVCVEDTELHKPSGEPMECYVRKTGAKKEEVLYIGDSRYDMECAKNAGVDCALALWGAASVKHIRADYYFPAPASILNELDRIEAETAGRKWISWAMELQFIGQAGVTYSKDRFDQERFERIRELSGEIMSGYTGLSMEKVRDLFCSETGFQTPKLDTRAAVIEDGKILLVKERDGRWSVPGGWVDVNEAVGRNAVKETWEEAGLTVVPRCVVALQDRNLHNQPAYAYGVCKIFFLCDIVEGEFKQNIETSESGWFSLAELPELAEEKITRAQIEMCFAASETENWRTVFD